jgi:hypothetical protein
VPSTAVKPKASTVTRVGGDARKVLIAPDPEPILAADVPRRRHALVLCLLVPIALSGCGDNADEKRLQREEIDRAKREAAHQARVEERQRQETRELKQEIAKLKRAKKNSSTTPATGSPPSVPRVAGTTSCGGDLFVGANTSCPFARNVRDAYASSGGGNTNVTAFSPATGRSYVMYCTGGSPHVCTGGNNASLYFP